MRHSNQRDAVLTVVKAARDHPTADTVYMRVREQLPDISLGTVYRNLRQLCDCGEIISLEMSDKSVHFDGNTDGHLHFLCKYCGKITDLSFRVNPPRELADMGYIVQGEKTVYYGKCNACANKIN